MRFCLGLGLGRRRAFFVRIEAQAYSPVAGVIGVFLDDRYCGRIAGNPEKAAGRDAVFFQLEPGG